MTVDSGDTMKAVVLRRHGSVDGLELADIPKPIAGPDQVLVRVHATTVTRGDVALRKIPGALARLSKLTRMTVLGHEFAGDVVAVGSGVTRFDVGDRVFGTTTGLPQGSHAEFVCVPETGILATVPDGITLEQAAPIPVGGMTALYFLRRGDIADGKRVLVYGASGSVGTFGVQIAAHLGATVTGVCSGSNAELVRSLGAEAVIDYTTRDLAANDANYDVVFDAVGKAPATEVKRLLTPDGSSVSVRGTRMHERTEDLVFLRQMLEAGALRAVIDRRYPLDEIREAHRYVETGRKKGNVVISIANEAV
jgi:NADPH:quinone reductase-like Zn-dependent oxidoreductase